MIAFLNFSTSRITILFLRASKMISPLTWLNSFQKKDARVPSRRYVVLTSAFCIVLIGHWFFHKKVGCIKDTPCKHSIESIDGTSVRCRFLNGHDFSFIALDHLVLNTGHLFLGQADCMALVTLLIYCIACKSRRQHPYRK